MKYAGKDCPKGMVQIEFVGCSPKNKISDYGWKPEKSAFLEVYIDGERYRIEVGDFHDGVAQRRGIHIVGSINMKIEKTSINACSIFLNNEINN
jgi:hypothetical protein